MSAKHERPVAVVLGAGTGVGAEIAIQLASGGYDVIGFHRGRHPVEATETERKLKYYSDRNELLPCDVGSSLTAVANGVALVEDRVELLGVDVVVHSLSGSTIGSTVATTPRQLERTFNLLAHSFLWWIQGLRALDLLALSANVLTLSNPCPNFYLRNNGVVGAAKAALEAYVKGLAVELGPSGTRINAMRFSTVLTPALRQVLSPDVIAQLDRVHKSIVPQGRMQTAEEVASFACTLLEDPHLNGAIVDYTVGATLTLMDMAFYGSR